MSIEGHKRKEAIRSLMNIALLEGMLLFAVVAVYLYTHQLTYLIGGVIASSLIFVPVLLRWARDQAPALKGAPTGAANRQ